MLENQFLLLSAITGLSWVIILSLQYDKFDQAWKYSLNKLDLITVSVFLKQL